MNRWAEMDTFRETWSFLVVDAVEEGKPTSYASAWKLGDGNADHFLSSEQYEITDADDEKELLVRLGETLDERRYQDITLITPTQETLSFLRARFSAIDTISQPTLRGFRHVALIELLAEYIEISAMSGHEASLLEDGVKWRAGENGADGESAVKNLWELRVEFGPLLPADALDGTQL